MVSDVIPGQLYSHMSDRVVNCVHTSRLMLVNFALPRKASEPMTVSLLPVAKVTVSKVEML